MNSPPTRERRPQQEAAPTVIPADDITTMVAPGGDNLPDLAGVALRVRRPCADCGRPLLLERPGRDVCAACSPIKAIHGGADPWLT